MIISQEEKGGIFLRTLALILRTVSLTVCKIHLDFTIVVGLLVGLLLVVYTEPDRRDEWLNVDPVVPTKANGGFHDGYVTHDWSSSTQHLNILELYIFSQ